jgi:glucosamine-6-phosphate deaminase
MKIICVANAHEMSLEAARILASIVRLNPHAVLGLATGSTPIGTYDELARMHREEHLDFSRVWAVNLDEYIGLSGDHPQSYRAYMETYFYSRVNIRPDRAFVPDGMADDIEAECRTYDDRLEQLGYQDIQLLGIGPNGHIAFNEPGDRFIPETHCTALTESTIHANQRFFDDPSEMPHEAISLGMRGIMCAKRILLLANGAGKAEAIADTCMGPVNPWSPGSILQLHPDVTVIADIAALSKTGLFGSDD